MDDIEELKSILEIFEVRAQSKATEHPEDAKLRRWKDKMLFVATLFSIGVMFFVCALIMVFDEQYREIALNGVISLGMLLVGYYARGARE